MNKCTERPSSCEDSQECMGNLQFVHTTNGGYDHSLEQGETPTGDCVVIATSIAAGLGYADAERRLVLLVNSLEKHRAALAAIADPALVVDVPEDVACRSPLHGTHLLTCNLFLIVHLFEKRSRTGCICQKRTPHVVTGITDDGSPHAVAVWNGQAFGTYDVVTKDFEVIDVWEREEEPLPSVAEWLQGEFASQRKVNALVKRRLLPVERHPKPTSRRTQRGP